MYARASRGRRAVVGIPTKRAATRFLLYAVVCALAILATASPLSAQRGGLALRQNLAGLVDEAAVIVRGSVVGAHVEPHPQLENLHTVVVTLRVERTLKGKAGGTFTFRQFIWDVRDRYDAAGYQKGQYVVLLVTRPSEYGLSSPVGLEQGRFRLITDAGGQWLAVNGAGNQALWRGLKGVLLQRGIALPSRLEQMVAEERAAPVPLDDLEEIIAALAAGK